MTNHPTNFLESNAILAAQQGDKNEVDRILAQMTYTELQSLKDASYFLGRKCEIWMQSGGVEL